MSKITAQNANEYIARLMLPDVHPVIVDLERSQGSRIFDAKEQRFLLDCFSYVASNPIGHNHPKMFEKSFEKKLLRVARTKPSSSDFHTVEMAEFVDTFSRLAMPKPFTHLFLVEGGAVAVENALKTAFDWKVRWNQKKGLAGEKGSKVIHFHQAFHGRCGYTLSITDTADPRKTKFFPKFDWPRIINPKIRFPLVGKNLENVLLLESQAIEQIKAAFTEHRDDIAAIIIEPIQSEGGDNHFRAEFHHQLRTIADENQTMLIYDEVQTGIGLTGKMWAYEHYGIVPDIICFGKKMQVCGIMATSRVEEVENHVFKEASRLNSTWGGSLVDMVRSQRYLEIITEENLISNSREVGSYLLTSVEGLCEQFPGVLDNPRGLGLLCAVDTSTPELRDRVVKEIFKLGAIILKCGTHSLRFRPSLNFSKAEVDELISVLTESISSSLSA